MSTVTPTTSWFDECWPRVTIATGIGYWATSYAISWWLTRRSPATITQPPAEFASLTLEHLACRTTDGLILKGWLLEPPQPRATIALFHGLRANRLAALSRIAFLTAAGYRCVAFDHRAHGESGGRLTSFGYFERHDVQAVAEIIHARWPNRPCAALGISMGGASICFAGAQSHAFDALILESVYHDLAATFHHRIGVDYPGWFKHFRDGVISLTERRFGVRIHQVSPLAHVADLAPRPVLLLTGEHDPHAPPHEVRLLADRLGKTGQLHLVPGAGHEDVLEQGGRAYQELILSFLEKELRS